MNVCNLGKFAAYRSIECFGGSGSRIIFDDLLLRGQGRPSPMGSRRSNTENQRNDLIRHDCGTIASPRRRVTICIHDYRPRKAERRKGKKVEFLGRGKSRRNTKNVDISACIEAAFPFVRLCHYAAPEYAQLRYFLTANYASLFIHTSSVEF